jgi:diaminopimelate decarboxylase
VGKAGDTVKPLAQQQLTTLLADNARQIETPCYLYSVSQVAQNYQQLKDALGTNLIYSMKANNNTDLLLRSHHHLTDGIEIASIGELNLVAGGGGNKYINNPSADKKFIRGALASKATVIIDNLVQLNMLQEFVGKRPIKPVLLRLNSCILKQFNPESPKVRPDHFGMDWDTTCQAIDICKEHNIPLAGFHLFNGSYSFAKAAVATAKAALAVAESIEQRYEQSLSFINLGGGFSEHWSEEEFDFEAYRTLLKLFPEHITLAHETGRGLMATAGFFATRVRYIKHIEHQQVAICDGGINQNFLLAKTENSFRKLKAPWIYKAGEQTDMPTAACTYVGSSCSKDDVIGRQGEDAISPQVGDICVYDDCGAYNASYTLTPFLKLPEAKVYIIE